MDNEFNEENIPPKPMDNNNQEYSDTANDKLSDFDDSNLANNNDVSQTVSAQSNVRVTLHLLNQQPGATNDVLERPQINRQSVQVNQTSIVSSPLELDSPSSWRERNEVITGLQHKDNISVVYDVLGNLVQSVPSDQNRETLQLNRAQTARAPSISRISDDEPSTLNLQSSFVVTAGKDHPLFRDDALSSINTDSPESSSGKNLYDRIDDPFDSPNTIEQISVVESQIDPFITAFSNLQIDAGDNSINSPPFEAEEDDSQYYEFGSDPSDCEDHVSRLLVAGASNSTVLSKTLPLEPADISSTSPSKACIESALTSPSTLVKTSLRLADQFSSDPIGNRPEPYVADHFARQVDQAKLLSERSCLITSESEQSVNEALYSQQNDDSDHFVPLSQSFNQYKVVSETTLTASESAQSVIEALDTQPVSANFSFEAHTQELSGPLTDLANIAAESAKSLPSPEGEAQDQEITSTVNNDGFDYSSIITTNLTLEDAINEHLALNPDHIQSGFSFVEDFALHAVPENLMPIVTDEVTEPIRDVNSNLDIDSATKDYLLKSEMEFDENINPFESKCKLNNYVEPNDNNVNGSVCAIPTVKQLSANQEEEEKMAKSVSPLPFNLGEVMSGDSDKESDTSMPVSESLLEDNPDSGICDQIDSHKIDEEQIRGTLSKTPVGIASINRRVVVKSTSKHSEQLAPSPLPQTVWKEVSDTSIFENEFVNAESNQSEAGPDVAQYTDAEFCSAAEIFKDPSDFDFLQRAGNCSAFQGSVLSRLSLYVKFDPLVNVESPVKKGPLARKTSKDYPKLNNESPPVDTIKEETRGTPVKVTDGSGLIDLDSPKNVAKASPKMVPVEPLQRVQDIRGESSVVPDDVRKALNLQDLLFNEILLRKAKEHSDKEKAYEASIVGLKNEKLQILQSYHYTRSMLVETNDMVKIWREKVQKDKQELTKDRDHALEDLRSVETAFGDLHRRYEKSKKILEGYKQKEDELRQQLVDCQEKLKDQEKKFDLLRNRTEEKLDSANTEIENAKKSGDSEITVLRAQLKKAEMKVKSLENTLEQKNQEYSQLNTMYDELIERFERQS